MAKNKKKKQNKKQKLECKLCRKKSQRTAWSTTRSRGPFSAAWRTVYFSCISGRISRSLFSFLPSFVIFICSRIKNKEKEKLPLLFPIWVPSPTRKMPYHRRRSHRCRCEFIFTSSELEKNKQKENGRKMTTASSYSKCAARTTRNDEEKNQKKWC